MKYGLTIARRKKRGARFGSDCRANFPCIANRHDRCGRRVGRRCAKRGPARRRRSSARGGRATGRRRRGRRFRGKTAPCPPCLRQALVRTARQRRLAGPVRQCGALPPRGEDAGVRGRVRRMTRGRRSRRFRAGGACPRALRPRRRRVRQGGATCRASRTTAATTRRPAPPSLPAASARETRRVARAGSSRRRAAGNIPNGFASTSAPTRRRATRPARGRGGVRWAAASGSDPRRGSSRRIGATHTPQPVQRKITSFQGATLLSSPICWLQAAKNGAPPPSPKPGSASIRQPSMASAIRRITPAAARPGRRSRRNSAGRLNARARRQHDGQQDHGFVKRRPQSQSPTPRR